MEDRVWQVVLGRLSDYGFSGRISYHLYGEPLLRRDFERFVIDTRAAIPASTIVVFTNGTLLTQSRYDSLVLAGVDQFIVTLHDGTPLPDRPKQILQQPEDLTLTNRAGALVSSVRMKDRPCYLPSEFLAIDVHGRVLQCYEDVFKRHVVADLMTTSLQEFEASEEHRSLSSDLLSPGGRTSRDLCSQCNNFAHCKPLTGLEV